MSTFIEDFKTTWSKPNNGLMQLIVLNVIVFVVLNTIWVFSKLFDYRPMYLVMRDVLFMPYQLPEFIVRPWTLFTYFFTHQDFLHILFNMLGLYWFGRIIDEYAGNQRLIGIYIYGGIAGGLLYLLLLNTIPTLSTISNDVGMIGASGSVYAIAVAAAVLVPNLSLHLLFFGAVQLKYLVAIYVFLSFIGLGGENAGGSVAHLGGALMGFVFAAQYRKGNDWSRPIWRLFSWLNSWRKPQPTRFSTRQKTTVGGSAKNSRAENGYSGKTYTPSQDEIDAILDKISAYGYESLTTEEKQILFKASQKK
jgi:membrane associated rhomboid family serine protease